MLLIHVDCNLDPAPPPDLSLLLLCPPGRLGVPISLSLSDLVEQRLPQPVPVPHHRHVHSESLSAKKKKGLSVQLRMAETNHKLMTKKSPPATCGHVTGRPRDELQVWLDLRLKECQEDLALPFLCLVLVIASFSPAAFSRHAEKAEPRQPQAGDCRVLIRIVD